jgi:ectoine hydroxylase-related dioxygenase (phytanoyl-CoA dioxygenase family)
MVKDEDIKAYETDGVVCLRGVFGGDWIETLRAATEVAMANPGPNAEHYGDPNADTGNPSFFGDLDIWTRNAGFKDFIMNSPAAEIIGQVMGASSSTFFYDQLLVKEPGSLDKTPWHQDQPYWAVDGSQVASIWLPMDVVSAATSVQYVKGSHKWRAFNPQHFADQTPYANTGLPPMPDIESNRADYDIVSYDLNLGDCIIFNAMMTHGAPGNSSAVHRRRAYATRWLGDDARYIIRPGEFAIPTFETDFVDGDTYSGDMFPKVWVK